MDTTFHTAATDLRRWTAARLPPVRLLLLSLVLLGLVSSFDLGGLGLTSLLVLPLVASVVDLLYQRIRFEHVRLPEAAVVTGLFLALLMPPTVNLVEGMAITASAIGIRHALRLKGRPWVNPAAAGMLLGAVLFGIGPAWWAAVSPTGGVLVATMGVALAVRQPAQWRLPVVFLSVYALCAGLEHFLVGGTASPQLVLLESLDPSMLFFGLFMVTEPRTSPSDRHFQPLYAAIVAVGSAFLPILLPTVGILFALFIGNGVAMAHRGTRTPGPADPAPPRRRTRAERRRAEALSRARTTLALRWTPTRRAASLGLVTLLVGAVSIGAWTTDQASPTILTGGSGGSGASYMNCQVDNPSIPSSTLQHLHSLLGPSVILSYDPNTGVTVFYDPVNNITVTETDLYEDFGYADFNGDDQATLGCSP